MNTHTRLLRLAASLFIIHYSFFIGVARAQRVAQPELDQLATTGTVAPAPAAIPVTTTAATPPPATSAPAADEVVEMSPFTVSANNDEGYMARETTSGSRVRTSLRDTSASISVFTQDFLNDVGAQSIEEMLSFATNTEVALDDDSDDGGTLDSRSAGAGTQFRIRGLAATVAVDGAEAVGPVDLYNVDGAEVSSGANSILFGGGGQGGTVTLSSLGANLQRNTFNVQATLGTWSSPALTSTSIPFKRLSYKYNVALIPKKWAIKLSGLLQDGGNSSWRKWMGLHDKRFNPTTTIKPFKNTTIKIGYEKGRQRDATATRWNLTDDISAYTYWLENYPEEVTNGGIMRSFGATVPSMTNLWDPVDEVYYSRNPYTSVAGTGSPSFVYISNDGSFHDVRGSYRSERIVPPGRKQAHQYRLDPSISSYYYSTLGPGAVRLNDFNSWKFNISQRIGRVNLDFTYTRNRNNSSALGNGSNEVYMRYDPNPTIGAANYTSSADNQPNSFAGLPYAEYGAMRTVVDRTTEAFRLQGEYSLNLKKYGRHRFIGMLERTTRDNFRDRQSEYLVDEHQRTYNQLADHTANPGGSFQRRNYFIPGDFSTYHGGAFTPLTGLEIAGRLFHSAFATTSRENNHVKTSSDAAMLAIQNYFFNGDLVTTLGGRFEKATYKSEGTYRAPVDDPLVLNKSKILNEWVLDGNWKSRPVSNPYTFSSGGVWHITNRLSSRINYSTNRGSPRDDGRTTLPSGDLPELTKGRSLDYGVTFDVTGKGKWWLTITAFDTRQRGDAAIGNVNGDTGVADEGVAGNSQLGADSLFNIYDALYFLAPTNSNASPNGIQGGNWPEGTGPGMGPMSAAEYAFALPSPLRPDGSPGIYPYGHPPVYTAGTRDTTSQGYEIELSANPTKSLSLRFTFSYTQRFRAAILPELFAFYNNPNTGIKHWLELAKTPNPDSPDGIYWVVDNTDSNNPNKSIPLFNYVREQIYGSGGVRDDINQVLFDQSQILGQSPYKLTFVPRYAFQTGRLKGLSLSASFRYNAPRNSIDPYNRTLKYALDSVPSDATDLAIDPDMYFGPTARNTIKGRSTNSVSAMIAYKCKIFGGRSNLRLQLNVNNIFTNDIVVNGAMTTDGIARRVYLVAPRQFKFTTTLDF